MGNILFSHAVHYFFCNVSNSYPHTHTHTRCNMGIPAGLALSAFFLVWIVGPTTLIVIAVICVLLAQAAPEIQRKMLQYKDTFMETFNNATKPGLTITEELTKFVQPHQQFHAIKNSYESVEDLKQDLKKTGLESSRMIIGIDFTQSNRRTGEVSFGGKSLHDISELNPYQEVISILGKTLADFDEDNEFLCFGFGDSKTKNREVCNLLHYGGNKKKSRCNGLDEVLYKYNEVVSTVNLSGPTSFTPLIKKSIQVCKEENQYYILIIITDGETMTPEEDAKTIVEASNYPISIICVGVGDGPWDTLKEFDDELPKRKFDNFQLVVFNEVTKSATHRETEFARHALMEIPEQFSSIKSLGYLKKEKV